MLIETKKRDPIQFYDELMQPRNGSGSCWSNNSRDISLLTRSDRPFPKNTVNGILLGHLLC